MREGACLVHDLSHALVGEDAAVPRQDEQSEHKEERQGDHQDRAVPLPPFRSR
jgi:hypothetical protein